MNKHDIAVTARVLRSIYPRAANDLRKSAARLADLRADTFLMERSPDVWQDALDSEERDCLVALRSCEECAAKVNLLAAAIPAVLPDLWPSLRLVDACIALGEPWHERKDFDWDAASGELRQTEATAMAKAAQGEQERMSVDEDTTPDAFGNDTKKSGKATVAARMIDLIQNSATHTWTARKFAAKLGCVPSAVVATKAWKELQVAREMARQERSKRAYHKNLSVRD